MQKNASESTSGSDQQHAVITELRRERAALSDQRKEIAVLIKQTVSEIDRLAQRNRDASFQMRQVEANLEAFSKAEIQQRFTASQELQMRLFMMQSQLEQLRGRDTSLERMTQQLDRVLEAVGGLLSPAVSDGPLEAGHAGGPRGAGDDLLASALQSVDLVQRRLSRQLQDGPAQAISDLILRAEVCERLVGMDDQKAKREMAGLRSAASAALKSTRQFVQELLPPLLEESGLVAGLGRYLEACRSGDKLEISFQIAGQERRLPLAVELAVFRVAQEALANAADHSTAGRADVKLRYEPGQIVATIADDGCGFDVDRALAEAHGRTLSGLAEMRHHAGRIGGTLEIGSRPGAGCMVTLAVPA